MYEIYPYFTLDGSVGLYSPKDNDIYHSTYGALEEAYEKFILPANFKKYFENNNEIKILDICFGIGYNSKIFLQNFFVNLYNDKIHTDNIINNEPIYTDNKKFKILIHTIDNDKILTDLSPFFISGKKNIKKQKLLFKNKRIQKILSENQERNKKIKIENFINILLLDRIAKSIDMNTEDIILDKKYAPYFDKKIIAYFKYLKNNSGVKHYFRGLNSFLHNIYYRHISISYKMAINALKYVDFDFDIFNTEARKFIKEAKTRYNYIFLDGFSPDKCPCLWTLDFFKALYEHLEDNGMILTYTNSLRVRNAMINAGFEIYKIFSETQNKFCGTMAIKSKSHTELASESDLVHHLSKYDLDLLKTKAGIFYRDENLELDNAEILKQNIEDIKNSNLISVTQYKKHNML